MAMESVTALEARLDATRRANDSPAALISALNDLAWVLRIADVARANDLASEARQLAIAYGDRRGQAKAARTLAMTIVEVDDLSSVWELGEEAMLLFDEVGDDAGRAASRDFLASVHEHIGDYAGGLSLALDALRIARDIGDPTRQGYALSSIGGILAASGDTDAAVLHLQEALGLFEKADNVAGIGAISARLSAALRASGRDDEALAHAEHCLSLGEQIDDEYLRMSALEVFAEIRALRGDKEEAIELYRRAIAEMDTNEAAQVAIASTQRVALARLLTDRGDFDEAERELRTVIEQTRDQPLAVVDEAAAHGELAVLYERLGRLEQAIHHLRRAQARQSEIARREAKNQSRQIELRAAKDAAEKDAELHRLRFVELHQMQAKLVEAQKMAIVGRLAAGTAHELNTPAAVLRSNAGLVDRAIDRLVALLPDDTETRSKAGRLRKAIDTARTTSAEALARIEAVAGHFRRFTQLDQADRRPYDVHEGLESALALLQPTLPGGISVECRFAELPLVEAWPRALNQAFMTVLQNAIQAVGEEGTVRVETQANTEHVYVRISDTGRGMTEAQQTHLFDVGWSGDGRRTKMRLGLAAAQATLQSHGGHLDVESGLGHGTTMTFTLPIASDPSGA